MKFIDADDLEVSFLATEKETFTRQEVVALISKAKALSVISEEHHTNIVKTLKGEIAELGARNAVQKETIKKLMGDRAK